MKYRALGNTGLKVSEIGLGCEGLLEKDRKEAGAIFETALEAGVNIMDMYSPDPDFRRFAGEAVRDIRDDFILQSHLCSVWKNGQYTAVRGLEEVKRGFEDMMSQIGTDYLDIGMIHYIDSPELWDRLLENGVVDYALSLKKQGRIRLLGVSSHSSAAAIKIVGSGLIDTMLFSVNPCYDLQPGESDLEKISSAENYKGDFVNMDPERQELYETCQRLGIGITVMKAFAGGELLRDTSPAGAALTVNQCLHYALTRPAVASVMTGAASVSELEESLAYESASYEEKDYASAFASFPRISWEGHCMYCGHCAPCPKGISVADVTKLLNLALAKGGLPETVREHYSALEHKAGECIECGACMKRCPFGVDIISNMREAVNVFGK